MACLDLDVVLYPCVFVLCSLVPFGLFPKLVRGSCKGLLTHGHHMGDISTATVVQQGAQYGPKNN